MLLHTHIHTTPHVHVYIHKHNCTHILYIVASADYTSVSMILGPFTSQQPRQCFNVPIINDAFIELNETFTARLTLIDSSVTTVTANRIIVDPPQTAVQITDNDLSKLIVIRVHATSQAHLPSPPPAHTHTHPVRVWMAEHET